MFEEKENTISDIVRADYRTADVFKKYGINYCCSGQVTIIDACKENKIDPALLEKELDEARRTIHLPNNLRFDQWKLDFLVDYIINVHHAYLEQALPEIECRLISFLDGHQKKYPELVKIHELFQNLAATLEHHKRYEEDIIFPYIKQVDTTYRRKEFYGNLFVRTLRKPLSNVDREHQAISEELKTLKTLTNGYIYPPDACTNHQVLYHKLREFNDDMVQHKHLENNILFPKAIELEQQLLRV
jgi:regulator of cell morphogenesis and NO signaling